jgi:hypothetical protein
MRDSLGNARSPLPAALVDPRATRLFRRPQKNPSADYDDWRDRKINAPVT